MSALENRFRFVDRTSKTQGMEENIWPTLILIPYYHIRVVAGGQRLHIFVIIRRWSLASLDGFVLRPWLN